MPKVSDAYLAARRRQILEAAAACFACAGFHRTSIQDTVRESEISAGLVYRYFADKEDIITAIVTEWHANRSERMETAVDAGTTVTAYLDRAVGSIRL